MTEFIKIAQRQLALFCVFLLAVPAAFSQEKTENGVSVQAPSSGGAFGFIGRMVT